MSPEQLSPELPVSLRRAGSRFPGMMRLAAYPLFFASGVAGLIYEVVWTRMLLYVFGAGLLAVTAVLVAFMAGLALGSAVLGRRSDQLRFPLRFYAMIEIAIGLTGFVLPFVFDQIDVVDRWAYGHFAGSFGLLTACRFVVAFVILLVPTTLMGATLPVLSRAMSTNSSRLGLHVGELYAVNTAGAVAGALLAGFYLLGRYGVLQTEIIAAILNFVAAAGAFTISTFIEGPNDAANSVSLQPAEVMVADEDDDALIDDQSGNQTLRLVLCGAFVSGLVAMAAQVLWSRTLVFNFEFLKNTTYAFSAMLAIFLTGLALGSAIVSTFIDRLSHGLRLYGLILLLTGVSIALSVFVLHRGAGIALLPNPLEKDATTLNWPMAVGNIMFQSAMVLGLPTLLMGMAFPVAARAILRRRSDVKVGGEVGRLYALNTFGAILGPLLACFIIIPLMGLARGLLLVAAAETLMGFLILWRVRLPPSSLVSLGALTFSVFLFLLWFLPRQHGMQTVEEGQSVVYYDEGPMATVAVVENNYGYRTINIDGVGVAGTDPMLQTDQKSLAHVPMLLVENPRAALTVGFGSGGASYSFLLHDRLEKVHCVEISSEVPRAAPYLSDANHNFLQKKDPRYRLIIDDARAYLQHSDQKYDVIATDCTDLRYKSNASLYDLEYFEFCREALNPGGMVVVWMPLGGLSDEMFRLALRTLRQVFPEMGVFYMDNEPTHYILLIGWRDKMVIDPKRIGERLAEADVKADLGELFLDDTEKILSCFITGGKAMEGYLAGNRYNTQGFPIIEFESPKYGYGDQPILTNLGNLMKIQVSSREFFPQNSAPTEQLAELDQYERALPHIIAGHAHYRKLEIEKSAKEYLAASEIAPQDESVTNLLTFKEIAMTAKVGSPWATLMLGRVLHLQNRADEAVDQYQEVARIISSRGGPRDEFQVGLLKNAHTWAEEIRKARKAAALSAGEAVKAGGN